jgi:capsular polysaccharide transport system permease protein
MSGVEGMLQVVYAIFLRETKTRFGESRLGFLWAITQPLLWILMFAGFYMVFGHITPPGMSVVAFLTTGIVPFALFRETAGRCLSAIKSNKGLLFYPKVHVLDLIVARVAVEAMTQTCVLAVLMGGVALYDGPFAIDSLIEIIGGLALASGLGASFGLLCCGLSVFSNSVERLFPSILRPVFWFCAIFHPVESAPPGFRDILLYNPLTHAIELVRDGWFPGYEAPHADPVYPMTWILVLLFFGLSLERLSRRHLELT